MEAGELENLVAELEIRLERMRSLYTQYFAGIEKLEPTVVRKEFDRRIEVLRKVSIRNTGLRFRFQTVLQRYNTYQTYWLRICRQIENGTYKRDLRRAAARFGSDRPPPPEPELDAMPPERTLPGVAAPPVPAVQQAAAAVRKRGEIFELSDGFDLDLSLDEAFDRVNAPAPARPAAAAATAAPAPARAPAPPPLPVARPGAIAAAVAASPTEPGAPKRIVITRPAAPRDPRAAPPPASQSGGAVPVSQQGAPPSASQQAPQPPSQQGRPPPLPPSRSAPVAPAAVPAVPTAPPQAAAAAPPPYRGDPPAARPVVTRPAPPAPAPAARAVAVEPGGLPDERVRQIYARYVDAKRANGESTAQVTFDALAKSLRDSSTKLRDKVGQGKNIDFEVTVKDGKTILKPIVK